MLYVLTSTASNVKSHHTSIIQLSSTSHCMMPVSLRASLGSSLHLFLCEACVNLHTWTAVLTSNVYDDVAPASTTSSMRTPRVVQLAWTLKAMSASQLWFSRIITSAHSLTCHPLKVPACISHEKGNDLVLVHHRIE